MKFSAFNADLSSLSADRLSRFKEACARGRQRGTLLKSGYFTDIGSSSMKIVAIGTDILLIVSSTCEELLRGVNIDDRE